MATFVQQRIRKKKIKQKKATSHTIITPMEMRRDHVSDQLIEAARFGNSSRVNEILKRLSYAPIEFESICEAFLFAAQFGSTSICDIILSNISKSIHLRLINPALLLSCKNGHLSVCKYLLSRGANIETRGILGETPLLIAAQNNHDKLCKYLLSCTSADILSSDNYGNNILHIALSNSYENIVYIILNYKIKYKSKSLIYDKNIHRQTPIQVCKSSKLIRLILTHIIQNTSSNNNIHMILDSDDTICNNKSPFIPLPVDNPDHIATSHLFWKTIGCGKDRCIFQSFNVYPFDRLQDSERIVVLTR
eukprot:765551_1